MKNCKVCDKELMVINMSHISTHNMTKEEYKAYGEVEPVEPEQQVETIWDSVDTNSVEYKMKVAKFRFPVELTSRMNITVDQNRKCPVCLQRIFESVVFVLLSNRSEIMGRRALTPQSAKHKACTIAIADIRDVVATTFYP